MTVRNRLESGYKERCLLWRRVMEAALDQRGMSLTDLAQATGIDYPSIHRYLRSRDPIVPVPPYVVAPLAEAVARPPAEMLQALGLIESDLSELASRLLDARTSNERLRASIGDLASLRGSALVVQAATAKGWAAAAWPAREGAGDILIHVADRLTLEHAREDRDEAALLADLGDVLRDVGAVPIRDNVERRMWAGVASAAVGAHARHRWSIPTFGTPHLPLATAWPHLDPAPILLVSPTINSWVNDVAAVVAEALGYGLMGTRDLVQMAMPLRASPADRLEQRCRMLPRLLSARSERSWVLHHFGAPPPDLAAETDAAIERATLAGTLVFLREDDAMIQFACRSPHATYTESQLRDCQDRWASIAAASPRSITVAVKYGDHPLDEAADTRRERFWGRSFKLARRILVNLNAAHGGPPPEEWMFPTGSPLHHLKESRWAR